MQLNQVMNDSESQSKTTMPSGFGTISLAKAIEDMR